MRLFTHKGRKRRFSRGTATHRARAAARASLVVGFRASISSGAKLPAFPAPRSRELSPPQPRRFLQGLVENEKLRTMEKALPVLHVNKLRFVVQHFPRFSLPRHFRWLLFFGKARLVRKVSREPWLPFVRVSRSANVLRREIPPLDEPTHRHQHGIRV